MTNAFGAEDGWDYLTAVAFDLEPVPAFEHWLYSTPETALPFGDDYLTVVSFPYQAPGATHDLRRWLYEARGRRRVDQAFARCVARRFLAGRLDLRVTAGLLGPLWSPDAPNWMPSEFAYVDSEFDSIPMPAQYDLWEPAALARALAEAQPRLDAFDAGLRAAARDLLHTLNAENTEV